MKTNNWPILSLTKITLNPNSYNPKIPVRKSVIDKWLPTIIQKHTSQSFPSSLLQSFLEIISRSLRWFSLQQKRFMSFLWRLSIAKHDVLYYFHPSPANRAAMFSKNVDEKVRISWWWLFFGWVRFICLYFLWCFLGLFDGRISEHYGVDWYSQSVVINYKFFVK